MSTNLASGMSGPRANKWPSIPNFSKSALRCADMEPPTSVEMDSKRIAVDDSIKAYAACHNVLETSELLENVLAHMSIRDLLLNQRICKTWKSCVDSSPTLQEGLFLKPAGKIIALENDSVTAGPNGPWEDLVKIKVVVNPLLLEALGSFKMARLLVLPAGELHLEGSALIRPEASWRNMLFTQPPLTTLDMSTCVSRGEAGIAQYEQEDMISLRSALDCSTAADQKSRNGALRHAMREQRRRLLQSMPEHVRPQWKQIVHAAKHRSSDPQKFHQATNHIAQTSAISDVLQILESLAQYTNWVQIVADAAAPIAVGGYLDRLPVCRSAKQLE